MHAITLYVLWWGCCLRAGSFCRRHKCKMYVYRTKRQGGAFPTAGLQYVRLPDRMTLTGGTSAFCPFTGQNDIGLGSSVPRTVLH
jgi:hypothetical protein